MRDDLRRFLIASRGRWASGTEAQYARHLGSLCSWVERRRMSVEQVGVEDLLAWLDSHEEWGVSSRHLAICACRHFFRWRLGADKSPAESLRLPKREVAPQRTLTEEKVARLLGSFDTSRVKGIRDLALVSLLLDTGLRASEVCSLRVEHLTLPERRCLTRVKGGKWAGAVFGPYTASALEAWMSIREQFARPGVVTVFVSVGGLKPGRPLSRDGLRVMFRRMGKKAGLGLISPHDMRRTFATLAIRGGAPTRLVQLAGRWSNLEMIERYTQALRPEDFDPYSPVNRIMGL